MNKKIRLTRLSIAIGGVMLLAGHTVMAGTVNDGNMTTFSSGTAAVASQVSGNFSEQTTQINDNDARINTNTGNIATNTTTIGNNTTNIGVNTSTVAGHETRITTIEGASTTSAAPVTVDCPAAGAIQNAIDSAAPLGRLTITINGTCSENVNITRDRVTLLGGTAGAIAGATSANTVQVTGVRGAEITNLTVTGGRMAIFADNAATLKIESSSIGDNTTAEAAFAALNGTVVTLRGGDSGNTFTGGFTSGDALAMFVGKGAIVNLVVGSNTFTPGTASDAIAVEIAGRVIQDDLGDAISVTVNGDITMFENSHVLLQNGTVTGDAQVVSNSTLTLEADSANGYALTFTGNITAERSASVGLFGNAFTLVGSGSAIKLGAIGVESGATVTGTLTSFVGGFVHVESGSSVETINCSTGMVLATSGGITNYQLYGSTYGSGVNPAVENPDTSTGGVYRECFFPNPIP